ncbi:MAG: hypothetical protein KDD55_05740 [Bdellovibrionales bacterium]|nr:hypothetical protein [Bdellovibrionales bacterium]
MFTFSFRSVFSLPIALCLSSCAQSANTPVDVDGQFAWQTSGSITIARPLPAVTTVMPAKMLGFLPSQSPKGSWLSIDRTTNTVALMDGSDEVTSTHAEGLDLLEPGRFELAHKQRNPLWYAPESYFTNRQLPTPAEGDSRRYLRGALGDFALFLDADTPLHSAPFMSEEISGIRIDEQTLAKMYYSLGVGDIVLVK